MRRRPKPRASSEESDLTAKLRLVFDLFGAGEEMMRQNLIRRHPRLPPRAIEEKLRAWLQTRPGAERGDSAGKPVRDGRHRPGG